MEAGHQRPLLKVAMVLSLLLPQPPLLQLLLLRHALQPQPPQVLRQPLLLHAQLLQLLLLSHLQPRK